MKNKSKIKWVLSAVAAALFAVFALGIASASKSGLKFGTPALRSSLFGEFGTQARRGDILAADGSALARTVKGWNVRFDPETARRCGIADNPARISNICESLELTNQELKGFLSNYKSRYVLVRSDVDEKVADWFISNEKWCYANGFFLEHFQKRIYPLGSNAVHVAGYVSRNPSDRMIGCTGVEHTCNSELVGKDGEYVRNAGRAEQIARGTPVHGGSVTTTIIPGMQNALADILMKAAATNGAETAWGIVMNATNGAIAAMASLPSYDPSVVRNVKDAQRYFINNAAMANFEPGGLMEPIAHAIALNNGFADFDVKADGLKLWKKCGFAPLLNFGFGNKVGGGTVYGEEAGIVRPIERCDAVTFSRIAFGQGIAVTGLQMAKAYAILVNGGKSVEPHLIAKTVPTPARIISESAAKEITQKIAERMKKTAKEMSLDFGALDIAGAVGKSPIPEGRGYSNTDFNVMAAGFFPVEKSQWVVAVGFSKPKSDHSTGRTALSAFAEIVRSIQAEARNCNSNSKDI